RTASSSQTSGKSEQLKEEEQICNKSNNNNNNNAAADFECSQKLITIFEADEPLSVNFGKQIPKSSNKLIHSNEPQNILRRIDGSVLGNRRKNCQEFNATLNVPNNDQTENATWKKSTVANADETSFMLSSFLRSSDLSDENLEVQETKNKVEEKKKKPMVQNDETTFVLSKFLQSSDISTEDYQKDAAGNEENLQPPEEKRIAEPSRESKSRMDENCSNLEDLGSKKLDVMFQAATKKNQCFEKLDKSISELKVKSFVIPQIIDENCSELDLMQQKVDLAEKKEFKAPRKSFASSTEKIDDSIIGRALANIDQLKAGSLEGIRNSSYATDKNVPKQKPLNILSNKKGSGTTCEEKTELSFFQRPPIAASTTNLDTNLVNKALKKSLEIQQNNKYNNDQQPTCKFLKPFTQAFQEEYHEFVKSSFLQNCVAQYPHSFDPNSRFNTRLPDIGTFRVKKQVAEGGFGKVYLAYCDGPKISKICIKACDDKYLKEIAISRVIQQKHSNLILRTKSQSFLDITQALIFNTCVLYVSEWLQGGTLSDLVDFVDKTYTPYLQIESLTLICHELCLIVDALAKMNIIHLDIKPDNFMLRIPSTDWKELSKCNPKNSCFLVLIDYGNAVDLNRFDTNVKCSGSIPTLNFACPQMLKSQLWTFEPDTFNLGLVIYFLIFKELFVVKERDNKVAKLIPRHLRGNNLWLNITNELLESRADANISYYAIELNKERQKLDLMPKDLVDYFISRIK
ncbi:MAG: protein kinase, partial [Marteilia pararefringens]